MDVNRQVKVDLWEDDDSEKADIQIRSIGCLSELRFDKKRLDAVGKFTSLDIQRLLNAIKEAEEKRIDPNPKMIEALEYVADRIHFLDDDKSRLYLNVELVMPVSSSGSVELKPIFEEITIEPDEE